MEKPKSRFGVRKCGECRQPFLALRKKQAFCGPACRGRNWRSKWTYERVRIKTA